MGGEELAALASHLGPVDKAVLFQVVENVLHMREALRRRVILPELHAAKREEERQDVGRVLAPRLLAREVVHQNLPELRLAVLEQELEAL